MLTLPLPVSDVAALSVENKEHVTTGLSVRGEVLGIESSLSQW